MLVFVASILIRLSIVSRLKAFQKITPEKLVG
jgi:hypothetical protein